MASWTGLTRVRFGIAFVIILIMAGIGYLVPRAAILNEVSLRADIISRLSAWSGGAVDVSGPFRLSYFPRLAVTTGGFSIKATPNIPHWRGVHAKGMTVELGLWSLVSDQADVRLITFIEPKIDVAIGEAAAASGQKPGGGEAASLIDAVRTMPVPEVRIVNGIITVSGPKTREQITGLNANAAVELPGGTFAATGTLNWREQPVTFDFAGTAPDPAQSAAKAPVRLAVRGPMISADIDGEGALAVTPSVTGSLDLQIGDLRGFARWLGLLIPDGTGLGAFRASGQFHWHGDRIGFDEGTYTLDGNRALGTLEVQFGGARPAIQGTLAFSAVDLAQYAAAAAPDKPAPGGKAEAGEEKQKPVVTNFPLLHHLDFDLRLSTNEIVAAPFTLGQVALSMTVKSGRLAADFAILDICGGTGNGRLTFDAAVPESQIRLTANVARLAARNCVEAVLGQSPVDANLDFIADLSSRGRTSREILRHLGGKIMVNAWNGEIGLDLAALKSRPATRGTAGWGQFGTRATPFSKASGELIFRQGAIFSDSLEIVSGDTVYSGEGTVSLVDRSLDLRLAARNAPPQTTSGESIPDADPVAVAFLTGSWLKPGIEIRKTGAKSAPETAGANGNRSRQ